MRIWYNDEFGCGVNVNGVYVEINLADGWSGRLTPSEAAQLAADLTAAVHKATLIAATWNPDTRTHGAA